MSERKKAAIMFYAVLIIILGAGFTPFGAQTAVAKKKEAEYQAEHCKGVIEHVLDDRTRVDCLTEEYAIEYDFSNKWAEAIGQAVHYGRKTGKQPGIVLIITKKRNIKHYNILMDNVKYLKDHGIDIKVWVINDYMEE